MKPEAPIKREIEVAGTSVAVPGTLVSSAAGAAGSLAGWAISSLGKKVGSPALSFLSEIYSRITDCLVRLTGPDEYQCSH